MTIDLIAWYVVLFFLIVTVRWVTMAYLLWLGFRGWWQSKRRFWDTVEPIAVLLTLAFFLADTVLLVLYAWALV